ncbi:Type I restriction modification DNA specificity domain-containing protein [Helcobacillus massiliensis]|uniref:restriction endonuclease subunit S n=1 Tax=Helcobacillus massiliensis TaxID=521392 RepID=UPI0039EED499
MSFKWPMTRLRYLAEFNPPVPSSIRHSSDRLLPLFSMETISNFDLPLAPELRETSSLVTGYAFITQDDVAYAKVTPCFENGKGIVGTELDGPAFATTELTVLRPKPLMNQRFLSYILRSDLFRGPAIASMTGAGGLRRVSEADMKDLLVPTPGLAVQNRISDYLDHETAEIDEFVKDLKTLQTLTVERRWAALNEQLSDLSLASTLTPLKVHAVIQAGLTLGTNYANKDLSDYPYLRVANVQAGSLDLDEIKTVAVPANVAQAVTLREGDVLVTEGGDRDKLGRGAIWPGHIAPMLHQNHVFAVRCEETLEPEYLTYVLEGQRARVYFDQTARQSTNLASTNVTLLRSFRFPVPSVEQQREFIKRQKTTDRICDAELEDITRAITLAKERRAALITAAVTGQIDVTKKNRPAVEQLQDDIEEQK